MVESWGVLVSQTLQERKVLSAPLPSSSQQCPFGFTALQIGSNVHIFGRYTIWVPKEKVALFGNWVFSWVCVWSWPMPHSHSHVLRSPVLLLKPKHWPALSYVDHPLGRKSFVCHIDNKFMIGLVKKKKKKSQWLWRCFCCASLTLHRKMHGA